MSKKPSILIYDIETKLNRSWHFGCGEQVMRHTQLIPGFNSWGIICITYCWNDGSPVKCIKWTPGGGIKAIIEEFDALVKQADFTIGKNSDRFDTKMINAQRMLAGLPGLPEWTKYTDDLEKQMRRYFKLPSQSLDYISNQLGLGGKIKMEFNDWVAIDLWMEIQEIIHLSDETNAAMKVIEIMCQHNYKQSMEEILKNGKKAMDKMCKYGMKDTRDTRTLWNKLSQHFETKINMATITNEKLACRACGSKDLMANGTRWSGKFQWRQYRCKTCHCYAGRVPVSTLTEREGKIG